MASAAIRRAPLAALRQVVSGRAAAQLLGGRGFAESSSEPELDEPEAVKRLLGRLVGGDRSAGLELARPFAAKHGLEPEQYAAHHASECAAILYRSGEETRQKALVSAGTGKAFEGLDLSTIDIGKGSLWLDECQLCWRRHHEMALLSGNALQLRGATSAEACEALRGDPVAAKLAARDWQVLGRAIPVRLNTSPWAAVLQSYASHLVLEEKKTKGFHPGVYGAMMKQVTHWAEHLGKLGPEGPLEDEEGDDYDPVEFCEWAMKSSTAVDQHIELTSKYWAEVAQHVLKPEQGRDFMSVAADMVGSDPSLGEQAVENAVKVFKDTQELL